MTRRLLAASAALVRGMVLVLCFEAVLQIMTAAIGSFYTMSTVFLFIPVYSCLFLSIPVYYCLLLSITIYSCLFLFITVYSCLFLFMLLLCVADPFVIVAESPPSPPPIHPCVCRSRGRLLPPRAVDRGR